MAVLRIDRIPPASAIATAVRRRVRTMLAPAAAKAPDLRLIRGFEIFLVAMIAVVVGSNIWLVRPVPAPPREPPAMPIRVDATVAAENNPFRTSAPAGAPINATPTEELADTTLQLTLHGTWVDEDGGAAIIGTPDNKQARFSRGDAVADGVTLDLVERDQVVILRNGVREALRLIKRDPAARPRAASAPGVQPAQSPQAVAMAAQGAALISDFVLAMPAPDLRGNMRIQLRPASDPAAFEALGLRDGDAVVAINNQQFGADIARGLEAIVSSAGNFPITLTIDREGVILPITINDPAVPARAELAE